MKKDERKTASEDQEKYTTYVLVRMCLSLASRSFCTSFDLSAFINCVCFFVSSHLLDNDPVSGRKVQ